MKQSFQLSILFLLLGLFYACSKKSSEEIKNGALSALQLQASQRAYPNAEAPTSAAYEAFEYLQALRQKNSLRSSASEWAAIGPWNTAGRALCLAVNYQNEISSTFDGERFR